MHTDLCKPLLPSDADVALPESGDVKDESQERDLILCRPGPTKRRREWRKAN